MCGIAGIMAYRAEARPPALAELERMSARLAPRGPDGSGQWTSADGSLRLAHRRLAIIDPDARAGQPMVSSDGRLAVTFNGEIYNFRELRRQLQQQGHVFRTQSDTEVLLVLYAERGPQMVRALRGMFAFAIWDGPRRRLLAARDPYGIKPLYYADDGGTLRFASQVKAIVASGAVGTAPDPAGWVGFFLLGSVPEPFTALRDIRALPAGTMLTLDHGGRPRLEPYHSIADVLTLPCDESCAPVDAGRRQEAVRGALLDSVRHHLVADVPVGIFLSAGIDSCGLLGLMRDAGGGAGAAVTLGYDELAGKDDDETPLAAMAARHYGVRHGVSKVTSADFADDLPRIVEAMDQPSIDGINTWFVSKAAARAGLKVAVSGVGGDELLGGYRTFQDVPRLAWAMSARPARLLAPAAVWAGRMLGAVPRGASGSKWAALATLGGSLPGAYLVRRGVLMPGDLGDVLDREMVGAGLAELAPLAHIAARMRGAERDGTVAVAALEATLYLRNQLLRDTDWASMAHGLEVRTPLVDHVLLEAVAPWMARPSGRAGLKDVLAASPSVALPDAIRRRRKTGFSIPVASWMLTDERLQSWRRIPALARDDCPWARRWAYEVARFGGAAGALAR